MKTMILALFLLSGCAGPALYGPDDYQQAAPAIRHPPRPPPVNTPGYRPNTPPEPTYTPDGAGASHGGIVTAPGKAPVPRSPNKRLLPASNEPGLWAADGAPVASRVLRTHLFGARLPLPARAISNEHALFSNICVDSMNKTGAVTGHDATISNLPEPMRTCMASVAYLGCVTQLAERHKNRTTPGESSLPKIYLDPLKKMAADGRAWIKKYCPEGEMEDALNEMLNDLFREWGSVMDAADNPIQ